MEHRLCLLPLLGLLALGYAAKCPKQRTSPGREILCYTTTIDIQTLEDSICRCTTLVHQGHDLQELSTSGIEDFQKSLKELNPVLQFVISVNDNEGSLKTSSRNRLEAAARIVRILNVVDGIELNVTAGTKERLVHFVQGLKTEMVRKSKEKRILLVLPTKPQDLAKQFDLKALSKYVDLFTIPTHYLIDDDEEFRTFHPSRLMGLFDMLNTDSLIDLVTGLGAGKRKIIVSLPASAYKFTLVNSEENVPRAPTRTKQPVQISRTEMCDAMEKGEWIVERDEDLTAPYAFKDDTWIAFEDKISAGIKGKYVLLRDLAGLGIHNIERDTKSKCGKSLTEEIYHSFTDNKRKTREAVLTSLQDDIHQKPNGYPKHVKSSEFRIIRVVDTEGHVHANRENMHTEFSCPRQGYFVHPKSCNRFYRCVKFNQGIEDYSIFEFDCPAGLAFDERTEVCVWPGSITEGSACPGSSEIAPSKGPKFTCPDHPGYYADPQNCRFFYACYDLGEHELTAYEFRCPYGLVFDEEKLICQWPYLVPSCGGGTYHRNDYGGSHDSGHGGYDDDGHAGSAGHGGHGNEHTGHGGNSGHGGYDESSHGEHGGSTGGGYDESGHGKGDSGHGSYGGDGHTTVHSGHEGNSGHDGSTGGGYDGSAHGEHGGSSGGEYDEGRHGHQDSGHGSYGGDGHTTVHSGYEGNSGHDGSTGGGYDGSAHGEHGGSSGGEYDEGGHGQQDSGHGSHGGDGHTTAHSGYDGGDTHGGSAGGSHGDGHSTTVHSGYGGDSGHDGSTGAGHEGSSHEHGESSGGGHDESGHDKQDTGHGSYGGDGHATVHSGYDGGNTHGGSTGGTHGDGHSTTVHSGYGGNNGHDGSTGGGYDSGHGSYGGDGHTTVHSGFDGVYTHGGSTGGTHGDGHTTTVHTGYGGNSGHDGSAGGGYDGSHGEHGGTSGGGYDESGHGKQDSGHGISGGYGHTTVHSGFDGGYTHGGSTGVTHGDGHSTTVHSGYDGNSGHGELTGGGYDGSHGEHGGTSGGVYDESGHGKQDSGHGSSGGYGHTTVHSEFSGSEVHGGSSGGSHGDGHTSVHTGYGGDDAHDGPSTTAGISGIKEISEHGYETDRGNEEYTTLDKGVFTGITSGVYDSHTPVIQYGGQTGSVVNHGDQNTDTRGSLTSGNAGSTIYHGNFGPGKNGGYYSSNSGSVVSTGIGSGSYGGQSTFGGSQGVSYPGSTSYNKHAGSSGGYTGGISTGSIASGSASQGSIGTGDSTTGTVCKQGDISGSILTGTGEHGEIVAGISQPGYVQTHSGTPGYVITNGFKTTYGDYNSKGTIDHGIGSGGVIITDSHTPGVFLTGHSSPGTYATGHKSPGVIFGGAVRPGTSISHSTGGYYNTGSPNVSINRGTAGSIVPTDQGYFPGGSRIPNSSKNPFIGVSQDTGYKTNEYHDNGGRGTIRYNNGEVTHKYTEDDVRDHQAQFGTYPKFDVGSYEMSSGDFTKTGPTKTGITTAELGGSGTYVSGTKQPRPLVDTQHIGSSAFSSNSGYSDSSSKISSDVSYGTSTSSPIVSYTSTRPDYESGKIDFSKINRGSTKSTSKESGSGYYYTKPAIPFNSFGVTGTTKAPYSSTKQEIPVYPTSPAPYLDVHVYNNPSIYASSPITPSPAVVNTYTYSKPSRNNYQETMYQAAKLPSSTPVVATADIYSRPNVNNGQKTFPFLSSTVSPIAFTTGPLENFKTTVFEAARIPSSISTVRPVIDNGYKTVVSSTRYPINLNTNDYGYSQNTGYRKNSLSTKDNSALDINVSFQPHLSTQEQYETIAPAVGHESTEYGKSRRPSVTQSVVSYERPAIQEQANHGSTGSSDYSKTNDYSDFTYEQSGGTFGQKISQGSVTPSTIYRTPVVTPSPKIYNVPTSTIAPAIGVTYRQPFQIVKSQPTLRVPSEGYTYSKPSINFGSTSPSIIYKNPTVQQGYTKNTGGSPTNLDISRTEVEKLITNYDRGSAKFTPSGYETYTGDRGEETTLNTDEYTSQQSYSRNFGQSYDSGKISSADKSQSAGYGRVYSTTPSYNLNTETRQYGNRFETSDFRNYGPINVNSDSSSKIGFVPSTTNLPISKSSIGTTGKSALSRRPSFYGPTTPAVTTYSGGYGRVSSTLSYETTTSKNLEKPSKGRGKVIVKFSDLHPLLLGKLGAECTCKADPFASFRSGKPLPINSSRGRVDLNNYDESEVYVDLESSKENGDYDSSEYITNLGDTTKSDYDSGKYETPIVAIFDRMTPATKAAAIKSPRPSSTYLPVSASTQRSPSSTYLPSVSTASRASTGASYSKNDVSVSASFTSQRGGGFRAGKSLESSERSSTNALTTKGTNFDRYGPGGVRGFDETLQGTSDCARPGLFRHPNYCNKFYACHWDEWKKKFTLHVFNCPVHLTFDSGASACNWPSKGPACQDDNLLV